MKSGSIEPMASDPGRPIRGPITLAEVTAGLVWPTLFRAVPLALQPSRIAIGFFTIALIMGLGALFDAIAGPLVTTATKASAGFSRIGKPIGLFESLAGATIDAFHGAVARCLTLDFAGAWDSLADLWFREIPRAASSHSGAFICLALLFVLVVVPVRALLFGAVARMVVCEVGLRRSVGIGEAVRFAASRWKSLYGAIVAPPVIIGALCLIMAVAGLALFRLPVLNVVGALLYGVFLLGGLVIVIMGIGFAFATHLTAPAIAADGADAVDALQRGYAYVLGRPGRLLMYTLILIALGVVAYSILSVVTALAMNVTASLAGTWSAADELAGRMRALDFTLAPAPLGLKGSAAAADSLIGVWERLFLALLAGCVVSYHDCASTLLYLLLRRAVDEQDIEDVLPPTPTETSAA